MTRRIRTWTAFLVLTLVLAAAMPARLMTAFAENGRIAFSDPSGSVGSQITVNMEITDSENLASADVMLAYDSNMLSLSAEPMRRGEPERSGFTETEEHRIPPSCGLP